MKHRASILVLLMVVLAPAMSATAQEGAPDQQAAMEAWMKAATPGEIHSFLAKKAGKWTVVSKMWMEPGGEPTVSESSVEAEMILGGRFLREDMSGMSMGLPFQGMGITGYDNTTGKITSVWFDTMGTVTSILSGAYATAGDPMVLTGSMIDPMTGMEMSMRAVTNFISADESRFEYFASGTGMPEMKIMELHYSRVK